VNGDDAGCGAAAGAPGHGHRAGRRQCAGACGCRPVTRCAAASRWCGWTTGKCAPTPRAAMPRWRRRRRSCAMRSRWRAQPRLAQEGRLPQPGGARRRREPGQCRPRRRFARRRRRATRRPWHRALPRWSAPFDAVVLATHVQAGDLAMPGRALVTLYQPGRMRAVARYPRRAWRQCWPATEVLVLADGQQPWCRRHASCNPRPIRCRRRWNGGCRCRPLPPACVPGQMVRVVPPAPAGRQPTPVQAPDRLPREAVLRRGELTAVYVATDRASCCAPCASGRRRPGVEVLAGLRAGERVAGRLRPPGRAFQATR
jgi:hypothetical protein